MQKVIGATLVAAAALAASVAVAQDNPQQERAYERSQLTVSKPETKNFARSASTTSQDRAQAADRFGRLDLPGDLEDWLRRTQSRPAGR
ncbi:MAG: hypothetical protein AAF439_03815 [Pseudomonadota bacterium]